MSGWYDELHRQVPDDCTFCQGASAAAGGEPLTGNPYGPEVCEATGSCYEPTDWEMWVSGG